MWKRIAPYLAAQRIQQIIIHEMCVEVDPAAPRATPSYSSGAAHKEPEQVSGCDFTIARGSGRSTWNTRRTLLSADTRFALGCSLTPNVK
jgi:hypothetical protein